MSILFSIARIAHQTERMRRIVTAITVLFSLIFLTFMAVKLWWLTRDLSWLKETGFYTKPARMLPKLLYVYQLCSEYAHRSSGVKLNMCLADCISDFILISLAVRLLWSINLPTRQRIMIIAIFSSNITVTMISIFRAVSQLMSLMSLVPLAADLEV